LRSPKSIASPLRSMPEATARDEPWPRDCVGLAFCFLRFRFESFDLGVDLVAFVPQDLEPVGAI
jgi:hypothetical protein